MDRRFAVLALLGILWLPWAALAQAPGPPEVYRSPVGTYQHLWLEFAGGPTSGKAFVGLRNGKATTAWFLDGAVPGGVKPSGGCRLLRNRRSITSRNRCIPRLRFSDQQR